MTITNNSHYVSKIAVNEKGHVIVIANSEDNVNISLHQDFIVYFGLLKGKTIDEHLYRLLIEIGKSNETYFLIKKKVSKKRYSQLQLTNMTSKVNFSPDLIKVVNDIFSNQNLINDFDYMQSLCNDSALKLKGYNYCQMLAKKVGIDSELIARFSENYQEEVLIQSRIKKMLVNNNSKSNIVNRLLYHGFNAELIKQYIDCIDDEFNIDSKLFNKVYNKYKNLTSYQRKIKITTYFYNKGYSKQAIDRVYKEYEEENK